MERHQTISHLVGSGYLAQQNGALALTERGVKGAEVVAEAVGGLYHELGHAVGEDAIATLRRALLALVEIKEDAEDRRALEAPHHAAHDHEGHAH